MKKAYRQADELGKQRSIGKFRALAEDGASVQLVLPLLEVMQMVQQGCGQLLREAGLRLMQLVMEEEADRLVGDVISKMNSAVAIAGARRRATV